LEKRERLLEEGILTADSKAKLLEDAERYILQGKIQPAISEYLKIVDLDPKDVLILNTIGDLHLRQNRTSEANKYFSQVAENYVQNNFLLKAIAVYKKILKTDPKNVEVNSTVASLYAKHGLSIDARNQYMRVAALLEQEGRTKEYLDVYEKIVELDPSNSDMLRKLAALHLEAGAVDKARVHLIGAARAQVRAGDLAGAVNSFERAMQLAPLDEDAMRDFLECCIKMKNLQPALQQLVKSVEMAPQNLDMREMLGRAYLESGDHKAAERAFQMVVSMDESRYANFFLIAQAFLNQEAYDQAINSVDQIVPILISRRETERAAGFYGLILQRRPKYIPALLKLASLYSATGDQSSYLQTMGEIADCYLSEKRPAAALQYLEKILQADPESEQYRELHRRAFMEANPNSPYVPPVELQESASEAKPIPVERDAAYSSTGSSSAGSSPDIVEVDLLLNYGLKEKALNLLLTLEKRDPCNGEIRSRLISLYKSEKKFAEAAEQCLLLAILHRRANNEELAQNCLAEAKQLDPDTAVKEADLEAFASRNGIVAEPPPGTPSSAAMLNPDSEVDLSSDLLDVFFSGDQQSEAGEMVTEPQPMQEAMQEVPDDFASAPSKSLQDQLQEVDFYIRLGFNDEALGKLNEIAKINPNHPELAERYGKLGQTKETAEESINNKDSTQPLFGEYQEEPSPSGANGFQILKEDEISDLIRDAIPQKIQAPLNLESIADTACVATEPSPNTKPSKSAVPNIMVNDMFADLMEEVGYSNQDEAKAFFEEHFSLGTAYREMDLIEEAIKEFESALKTIDMQKGDPKAIQCCGMLSTCFLKKNMPRSALRWCQTGLGIADISSHEAMALRYDMGIAHWMAGSTERALECFDQIFSADPSYRDVAKRIDELRGGLERHAP
jgi:tetratricopeptide (TPR) repeat protein